MDAYDLLVNPHRQADASTATQAAFAEYYDEKFGPDESRGHIAFTPAFEYYERDGEVYRAYVGNPLDAKGYRQGGRWECSISFLPQLRKVAGF